MTDLAFNIVMGALAVMAGVLLAWFGDTLND